MAAVKYSIKMSRAGKVKLLHIRQAAPTVGVVSLRRTFNRVVKPEIARLAPDPKEEADILSRGRAQDGKFSGQVVGTSAKNRFFKVGASTPFVFRYLQDAIKEAMPTSSIEGTTKVVLHFGDPAKINPRIGFGWRAQVRTGTGKGHERTVTRSTADSDAWHGWNEYMLHNWELGGSIVVMPRDKRKRLHPEEGVSTSRMIKTIKPRKMFSGGLSKTMKDGTLVTGLRSDFRKILKGVLKKG